MNLTSLRQGFTIVELLIVIVVIGILAAISIAVYSGVQQRANNSAVIDAASKTIKMVNAYIATYDKYPYTGGDACVTTVTGCADTSTTYSSASTFNSNIALLGSVPLSIPKSGTNAFGIRYNYTSSRTFGGDTRPVVVQYFLQGFNQKCGVSGVMQGSWTVGTSSTTGYFRNITADGTDKTECIVSVGGLSQ